LKRSMKKPKTMRIFKTKQSSITMKIQKKMKKLQTLRTKLMMMVHPKLIKETIQTSMKLAKMKINQTAQCLMETISKSNLR